MYAARFIVASLLCTLLAIPVLPVTVIGGGPIKQQKPTTDCGKSISLEKEWEKVIDVQMHFNEMLMTLRQIGISAVIAVFGAAAVALGQKQFMHIKNFKLSVAAPIVIFGLGLLVGTWYLDHQYYYKMLLASVEKGEAIDKDAFNKDGRRGLTTTIRARVQEEGASSALNTFYLIPGLVGSAFLIIVLFGSHPREQEPNQSDKINSRVEKQL